MQWLTKWNFINSTKSLYLYQTKKEVIKKKQTEVIWQLKQFSVNPFERFLEIWEQSFLNCIHITEALKYFDPNLTYNRHTFKRQLMEMLIENQVIDLQVYDKKTVDDSIMKIKIFDLQDNGLVDYEIIVIGLLFLCESTIVSLI